jgi:hypothetical protein
MHVNAGDLVAEATDRGAHDGVHVLVQALMLVDGVIDIYIDLHGWLL